MSASDLYPTSVRYRIDSADKKAYVIVDFRLVKSQRLNQEPPDAPVWQMAIDDEAIANYARFAEAVHEGRVLATDVVAAKVEVNEAQRKLRELLEPRSSFVELQMGVIAREPEEKETVIP